MCIRDSSLTLSGLPAYVSASRLMRRISGYCFICWRTKQEPMKPQPPVTRIVSLMLKDPHHLNHLSLLRHEPLSLCLAAQSSQAIDDSVSYRHQLLMLA